jgi:hypothetical protein
MITPDMQRAVIQQQIAEWEQARYSAEVAHRVHTRLKSGEAALNDFADRMIKAEYAIDELQKLLKELDGAETL